MAVFHPTNVSCPCGGAFRASLARSINVKRSLAPRDAILARSFQRVRCPSCARALAVERPFSYVDPDRGAVFFVQPRGQRTGFRKDSRRLDAMLASLPREFAGSKSQVRVVYGLEELREKLVAQDAGLDDALLEVVKLLVLYEHPFLMKYDRLQLFLSAVAPSEFRFDAYHHNRPGSYAISLPRAIADDMIAHAPRLQRWEQGVNRGSTSLFRLHDAWVNIRRFTQRYEPLAELRERADAIRSGRGVRLDAALRRVLAALPKPEQLPRGAKQDLRTLFEYAQHEHDEAAQRAILQTRFAVKITSEWLDDRDPNDLGVIWRLFSSVPVTNIEGNTSLRTVTLSHDDDGGGSYQDGVIEISEGELGHRESFEDTLRHEVGHSVQAQRSQRVVPWLTRQFGWREYPSTNAGVDGWVEEMGGWGELSARERVEVRQTLRMLVADGGNWGPTKLPKLPHPHPWWSDDFGPRLAFEQSKDEWWKSFREWHRVGGKAFFVNFWYGSFMSVAESTLEMVKKMPDSYAAMSQDEFFAEVYATYYDDGPEWRDIPKSTAQWLDRNIGRRNPRAPRRPGGSAPPARRAARRPA